MIEMEYIMPAVTNCAFPLKKKSAICDRDGYSMLEWWQDMGETGVIHDKGCDDYFVHLPNILGFQTRVLWATRSLLAPDVSCGEMWLRKLAGRLSNAFCIRRHLESYVSVIGQRVDNTDSFERTDRTPNGTLARKFVDEIRGED